MPSLTNPKLIVEFIGTLFLCLVVTLSGSALAAGATYMVMIYAGGPRSGGHFNPAVTAAVFLRGRISKAEGIQYLIAQGSAAVVAVILFLIWRDSSPVAGDFTFKLFSRALCGEILGTFALTYVVLNLATTKALEGNSIYGTATGLTFFAMLSTFPGAAFNPAVALTQTLSGAGYGMVIITCLVGASLGAFASAYVLNMLQSKADGPQIAENNSNPSDT